MKQLELEYPAHNYTETSKSAYNKQKPKLNMTVAKLNKTWAKCKANQAKVKPAPCHNKQNLG